MKFYGPSIALTFGVGCVHAQVIKKIKKDRVVKVGTKLVIGSEWRLEDPIEASEDSTKLNTAVIEGAGAHFSPSWAPRFQGMEQDRR
jgi:hypothetical protein